jgi:hypothetical protein
VGNEESKTDSIGRASQPSASDNPSLAKPKDFAGVTEYLASQEAKLLRRQMILSHQIFRLRVLRESLRG